MLCALELIFILFCFVFIISLVVIASSCFFFVPLGQILIFPCSLFRIVSSFPLFPSFFLFSFPFLPFFSFFVLFLRHFPLLFYTFFFCFLPVLLLFSFPFILISYLFRFSSSVHFVFNVHINSKSQKTWLKWLKNQKILNSLKLSFAGFNIFLFIL